VTVSQSFPTVSIVVPVFNERGTLEQLHREVSEVLKGLGCQLDLVFVDDGSTDGSGEVMGQLAAKDPRVRVFTFRSNQGKADALNVGFEAAKGDAVITMDADLQDRPTELPRLLEALEKTDLVSGWKIRRHDPLGKTLPIILVRR